MGANNPSRMHSFIEHLPTDITRNVNLKEILRNSFNHLANLEDRLITLFPQLNQGKVDNPFQTINQAAPVPPAVSFSVTQKSGFSTINIKLPQIKIPQTSVLFALLVQRGQNAALSPLFHKVQSASTAAFDETASVQEYDLGIGVWTIPDANPQWRLQSSFDTINFNGFSAPQAATVLP